MWYLCHLASYGLSRRPLLVWWGRGRHPLDGRLAKCKCNWWCTKLCGDVAEVSDMVWQTLDTITLLRCALSSDLTIRVLICAEMRGKNAAFPVGPKHSVISTNQLVFKLQISTSWWKMLSFDEKYNLFDGEFHYLIGNGIFFMWNVILLLENVNCVMGNVVLLIVNVNGWIENVFVWWIMNPWLKM